MKLDRFHNASQFYERARYYLLGDEAQHNLLLGIVRTLIQAPQRYENPYLTTVEESDRIIAIAIQTPPRHLVLSNREFKSFRINRFRFISRSPRR
jgi:uncharacterized protein